MMICNINKIEYKIGYYKNIEVALFRLNSKIVLYDFKYIYNYVPLIIAIGSYSGRTLKS